MVTAATLNSVRNPVIIPAVTGNEAIFFFPCLFLLACGRRGGDATVRQGRQTVMFVRSLVRSSSVISYIDIQQLLSYSHRARRVPTNYGERDIFVLLVRLSIFIKIR